MLRDTKIKKILNKDEVKLFTKLSTPQKIQDFINTLAMREDSDEPIVRSPREALINKELSCIEGAMLACAILKYHGQESYLLDLKVSPKNNRDSDHVVAVFKLDGHFGAISKTKHNVLRYREPIYKSIRELAMTYFHEYFLDDGKKNLRSYSEKFPIFKLFGIDWIIHDDDLYEIACALDDFKHFEILTPKMLKNLRKADAIEIKAGLVS